MKTENTVKEKRIIPEVQPSSDYEYVTPTNYAQTIDKSRERVNQMFREGKLDYVKIDGVIFVQLPK